MVHQVWAQSATLNYRILNGLGSPGIGDDEHLADPGVLNQSERVGGQRGGQRGFPGQGGAWGRAAAAGVYIRHPTPRTLHPPTYLHPTDTLHPTPYTLHPTPYTLYPTLYTKHPTPHTMHRTPYTLHQTPYTLHHTPYTIHPSPDIMHPTPNTIHPATHALIAPETLHPKPYNPSPQPSTLNRRRGGWVRARMGGCCGDPKLRDSKSRTRIFLETRNPEPES